MIQKAIRTFLRDSNAVRDKVGTRIYSGSAPRGTNGNYIILRIILAEHLYDLENEIGLRESVMQVDCYEETPTLADELGEVVRKRMSGYRGLAGDVFVQSTRIVRDSTAEVPPADASDKWIHLRSMDFSIYHDTAIPFHV